MPPQLFDAFVAYSAKDDSFVRQMMAPELEVAPPDMALSRNASHSLYKLCLLYRDVPQAAASGMQFNRHLEFRFKIGCK